MSISLFGQANQSPIDSLEQYAKIAKPGWDQIDVAIGLGRLYVFAADIDNAKRQIERVYQLSEKYNRPEGRAYGLIIENLKANIIENDHDKANAYCIEAIKIARETKCTDALVFASYLLAENYGFRKGDWEQARETLVELIPEIDGSVLQKNEANTYKTLGFVYQQLGDYEKSFENLNKALIIFTGLATEPEIDARINRVSAAASNPEIQIVVTLNHISDVYVKQGDTDTGLQYKLEALKIARDATLRRDIAWMNTNIGTLYSLRGNYKEALKYAQAGRILYEEMKSRSDIIRCNDLLVTILRKLKDYDVAERYVNENIAYYAEAKDSLFLAFSLLQAIELQFDKKDWPAAQDFVDRAETLIKGLNQTKNEALLEQAKGRLSFENGDFKNAAIQYSNALKLEMK